MSFPIPATARAIRPRDGRSLVGFVGLTIVTLAAVSVIRFESWPDRLMAGIFGLGLATVAAVDLGHRRIPDRLVGAQILALGIAATVCALDAPMNSMTTAVIGAGATFLLFFLSRVIAPSGIGMGDVKQAIPLGFGLAWFSPLAAVVGVTLGFAVNGLVAVALVATHRARLGERVPFGPSLALGAVMTLVLAG